MSAFLFWSSPVLYIILAAYVWAAGSRASAIWRFIRLIVTPLVPYLLLASLDPAYYAAHIANWIVVLEWLALLLGVIGIIWLPFRRPQPLETTHR